MPWPPRTTVLVGLAALTAPAALAPAAAQGAPPSSRLRAHSGEVATASPPAAPDEAAWAPPAGAELRRGAAVRTAAGASAAIELDGRRHLALRERTTLRLGAGALALERGTLVTRIAGRVRAGALRVTTPAATIELGGGSALVRVDDDGATTVANHDGAPLAVVPARGPRQVVLPGAALRLAPPDAAPPRPPLPRLLPRAPRWTAPGPIAVAAPGPGGGALTATWQPVAGAAGYHVELEGPAGAVVLAAPVPAAGSSIELHGLPPGGHRLRVAALDGDGAEGPAAPLALDVVAVEVSTPGGDAGLAAGAAPRPGPAAPPPPPRLAQGSALGGDALACEAGGGLGAPLTLTRPGRATVRCTTVDGRALTPFEVEVVAVTATVGGRAGLALVRGARQELHVALTSEVALGARWRVEPGPGLTCDRLAGGPGALSLRVAVDGQAPPASTLTVLDDRTGGRVAELAVAITDAPAPTPSPSSTTPAPVVRDARPPARPAPAVPGPPRPRITAGAFVGWTAFPTGPRDGVELGDAPVSAYQIDSGAGAGMRAAWWPAPTLLVELDAALWPTGFVAADEPAWLASAHAVVGHRFAAGERLGARAVLGVGAYALLGDATYARADVDPDVVWGVTGTWRLGRELTLRLDGRHHLAPDRTPAGVTSVFEVALGIETTVTTAR